MRKSIFVSILLLAFMPLTQAKPLYDYVKSTQVNHLEITKNHSLSEVQQELGTAQKISKLTFSECTTNNDAYLTYRGKEVRLEYFPEDNEQVGKSQMSNPKYKAHIWMSWTDVKFLNEKIKVGSLSVDNTLSLAQFKKAFPLSAKRPLKSEDGSMSYIVLLGDDETNEDTAYRATVQFGFRNSQLLTLDIDQGLAC